MCFLEEALVLFWLLTSSCNARGGDPGCLEGPLPWYVWPKHWDGALVQRLGAVPVDLSSCPAAAAQHHWGKAKTSCLPCAICRSGARDKEGVTGALAMELAAFSSWSQLGPACPRHSSAPQPSCAESMANCCSSPPRGEPSGLQLQGHGARGRGCTGSQIQGSPRGILLKQDQGGGRSESL